jgi:hypothetical protein
VGLAADLGRWSKAVRARDRHICQRCKRAGQHAHHVAPRSQRPDLRLDLENGMTLCLDCHEWVHKNPKQAEASGFLNRETYEMAKKKKLYRDAETGRIVNEEYAKANPKTTVKETVDANVDRQKSGRDSSEEKR